MATKIITALIIYIISLLLSYGIARKDYSKFVKNRQGKNKLSFSSIIVISLLFTVCNIVMTKLSQSYGGDRTNYLVNFTGARETSSLGLQIVINFVRIFSSHVEALFYITTFIATLISLLTYRKSEDSNPRALLYLLSTQYIFATFVNLKQCYANAIGAYVIVLSLNSEKNKITKTIILLALALLFHPSAFFLIFIIVLIKNAKSKNKVLISLVLMTISIIAFEPILSGLSMITGHILPSVSGKITQYLAKINDVDSNEIITLGLAKMVPYILLMYVGFAKRNQLIKTVKNYDNYLILTSLLAATFILGIYNAWFTRLSYYLYIPVAILYSILYKNLSKNSKYRLVINISMIANYLLLARYIALIYVNYGGI